MYAWSATSRRQCILAPTSSKSSDTYKLRTRTAKAGSGLAAAAMQVSARWQQRGWARWVASAFSERVVPQEHVATGENTRAFSAAMNSTRRWQTSAALSGSGWLQSARQTKSSHALVA